MEKEVESSTTLAGETLAEPEQTLLGNTNKKEGGAINYGSFEKCDDGSQQKHAENPQRMSMQHGHKYSPFFKTQTNVGSQTAPSAPTHITHPPFVSLLRNNF